MRYFIGVIFAVAAFLLVMMCMPQTGAIYSHDTQSYEYAASTLLESGDFKYFGYDTPIIQWPPFYIIALAFLRLIGESVAQGAAWLNAVLFAYLIYASAVFLYDILKVKWLVVPAMIMMTASVPLLYVSGYAWSEMLFIFLSVLSVLFLLQYIRGKNNVCFYAAAVFSGFCWLTRYIGIVLLLVLSIALVIGVKTWAGKLKRIILYLFISGFPMSLWVLRNYLLSGTFTGGRQPGTFTLIENIALSIKVFGNWSSYWKPVFTYIAVGLFTFLAVIAICMQKSKNKKGEPGKGLSLSVFVFYTVLYSAILLASASAAAMDPINNRLWAPVFPFWVFSIVLFFDVLIQNIKLESSLKWFAAGFAVFALVAVINPIAWIQMEGLPRKVALAGTKESEEIKNAPLLRVVKENLQPDEDTLIISNKASILAMHTGMKCYYPPKKNGIALYTFSRYKEKMENFRSIYLAWYGETVSVDFMDIPQFREKYELELVAEDGYCVILRVKGHK